MKAKNFVVAVGGRPRCHENIPKDVAINSDDLFSLEDDPGTTLVVGGGYIAVECAGLLKGLGKTVYLINRSTFLRSMDTDMAQMVTDDLRDEGVKLMKKCVVDEAERNADGKIKVSLMVDGSPKEITVDNVLVAIGRDVNPQLFGAANAGIEIDRSGKIIGRDTEPERTTVDHIYAVGDCLQGVPELMPVAQKSGKLLAHRIAARQNKTLSEKEILDDFSTDYRAIPTTVFSPTEYSFVGLSE